MDAAVSPFSSTNLGSAPATINKDTMASLPCADGQKIGGLPGRDNELTSTSSLCTRSSTIASRPQLAAIHNGVTDLIFFISGFVPSCKSFLTDSTSPDLAAL